MDIAYDKNFTMTLEAGRIMTWRFPDFSALSARGGGTKSVYISHALRTYTLTDCVQAVVQH